MERLSFSPLVSLEYALTRWWVVVVCMLAGASVGWVFHLFTPPIYEATGILRVTIDYLQVDLTQFQEDTVINATQSVVQSTSLTAEVLSDLRANGLSVDSQKVQLSLEVRQSVWYFIVRSEDALAASEIANLWSETAYSLITQGRDHAVQAAFLQTEIAALENCITFGTSDAGVDCGLYSLETLHDMLAERYTALSNEQDLSLGIPAFLIVSPVQKAGVPEIPVQSNVAVLVLAGAFLGLFVSPWIIALSGAKKNVETH